MRWPRDALLRLLALTTAACGANVVFEDERGGSPSTGGAGGATSGPTTVGVGGGGPGLVEAAIFEGVTSGPLAADVEPGTLGLTAIARAHGAPLAEIEMRRLTSPTGAIVVDQLLPTNGWKWDGLGALAAGAPQVSHPESFPLASGSWSFDFQSPTTIDVSIWRRSTADGAFHGGVIDVNVFSPAGLVDEAHVLATLASAYEDWAGLELGDVTLYTIADDYLIVDDENLVALLDETKIAVHRPALNIMATASIAGSLQGAAGFSVGIPGIPVVHGTPASGIVWMVLDDPFFDPLVLRHESGHYGGLFHTTEFQVGLEDPLDDTPACADASAMDACPDWDLAMFPSGGSGAGTFSPEQTAVLQGSALYRGVYADGEAPMAPYGAPIEPRNGRPLPRDDVDAARSGARRNPATRRPSQWSTDLPSSIAAALEGIGCPAPGGATYFEELSALAPLDEELLSIGLDASAPAYVRRRALAMLGRRAMSLETADAFEELAFDPSAPWLVRASALESLARIDEERARSIAVALLDEDDALLQRAVSRIRFDHEKGSGP